MCWFRFNRKKKPPQEIQVPGLHFLGEQDGLVERKLKDKLTEFMRRDQSIKAAYLARVSYGERSSANIALCLRTQFGPDQGLVDKFGRIFGSIFAAHEHMDIVFLSDVQESALTKVCRAFFCANKM